MVKLYVLWISFILQPNGTQALSSIEHIIDGKKGFMVMHKVYEESMSTHLYDTGFIVL